MKKRCLLISALIFSLFLTSCGVENSNVTNLENKTLPLETSKETIANWINDLSLYDVEQT